MTQPSCFQAADSVHGGPQRRDVEGLPVRVALLRQWDRVVRLLPPALPHRHDARYARQVSRHRRRLQEGASPA